MNKIAESPGAVYIYIYIVNSLKKRGDKRWNLFILNLSKKQK